MQFKMFTLVKKSLWHKTFLLSLSLALVSVIHTEEKVICITNFTVDSQQYTQFLQSRGYHGKMVVTDIKSYEKQLLKKNGNWLKKMGLGFLNRIKIPDDVGKIVFFNVCPKTYKKYDLSRFPREKMVLFMWEPKTVLRKMYSSKISKCFSQIYTWDDSLVDNQTYFKFYYPVLAPMTQDVPSFESKKLCTLVSSNLKSSYKNELYNERKNVIRYFEENGEEGFEFYGRGWESSGFKSYRGSISDKIATIKNYRFCICYENTYGALGYITEKIFDCFAASVVPIYLGASNVEDYIPSECFIDRRKFSSMEELHLFLKNMDKESYENYLSRIRSFLNSDAAKPFTYQSFIEQLYKAITNTHSKFPTSG